jgi:chromosome segregation ATPase
VTARRTQLVILLSFFGLIGIFAGVAIWLMNQSQQKERDLMRVQSELTQTTQQMQILKEQNTAALTTRSKLQKDFATLKKQLDNANKQGLALEQKLKAVQAQFTVLATENSSLKVKLSATEQQLATLRQSFKPASSPTPAEPTTFTPPKATPIKR